MASTRAGLAVSLSRRRPAGLLIGVLGLGAAAIVNGSGAAAQVATVQREVGRAVDRSIQELTFTEDEERQIGADVSAKLRERYGVVQNAAVHRYVALAGSVLATQSTRPGLKWTFIVLDTDGVNAFAAPGGYIHVTRGALALADNEAELAGVLGHEIGHVAGRHTLNAIRKSKIAGVPGAVSRVEVLGRVVSHVYGLTLENAFSRGEEKDADKAGVTLASGVGYAPGALGSFLRRLAVRNRDLTARSGLFASHPETEARLKSLDETSARLPGAALVEARYAKSITYKPVAVAQLAQVAPPAATPAPEAEKKGGKGLFGLGGLASLGRENANASTTSATGSRGLNPDRDARGGANKALVVVNVSPADVQAFRAGITR
jgi:predicted Zn-dependent protease